MQAAVLAVQEAFAELSSIADNNSGDNILQTLLSYELLSLADRITDAITSTDPAQLAQCLRDCNRLKARTQAVRRLSLHHLLASEVKASAP